MLFNKKSQRLGDMAAGTAVIGLKDSVNINHTILEYLREDYKPSYPNVIKLSDNETANSLLSYLTTKGEVSHFVEVIPSANDIFIQAVKNN